MSEQDGGPAFPQPHRREDAGMSLRDYFAAQALSGWYGGSSDLPNEVHLSKYAEHFYLMADAMLKARQA